MQLKTEKIFIREIESYDIENVFKGLSNPDIVKYYGVSFTSLAETKTQMDWFADAKQQWFAICDVKSTTFFGAGGFNDICLQNRKAEIGFWLFPEYWGKGIMKEAIPLLCNYAFTNLQLHRIEGFVDSKNENCKRALSKLDFQFEGTMKDCELKQDQFISLEIYSKINH